MEFKTKRIRQMKQKFVDRVHITLSGGHGGRGAVHFQSSARSPRGGPDGGDGGDGGDVFLKISERLRDLSFFCLSSYKAENGKPGEGGKRKGAKGKDLVLSIPPHTRCCNPKGQLLCFDPLREENKYKPVLLAKGGRGGKGNAFFRNARRQAPRTAQDGEPAQTKKIILEMQWPSHLALIGLKGVGKSRLLSYCHAYWKSLYSKNHAISDITPVKENHAFTCPRRMVLKRREPDESLWVTDLPGLSPINVANKKVLRQAETAKALLFVVSLDNTDPFLSYQSLIKILRSYDEEQKTNLLKKPRLLLLKGKKTAESIKKEKMFKEVDKLSFFVKSHPGDMEKLFLFLNNFFV